MAVDEESESTPLMAPGEFTLKSTAPEDQTFHVNNQNTKRKRSWIPVAAIAIAVGLVSLMIFSGFSDNVFSRLRQFARKNKYNISDSGDNWMPHVNVGNYSFPITIACIGPNNDDANDCQSEKLLKEEIQKLFDNALMECYGFAFSEARTTAQWVVNLVEDHHLWCPMCYWLVGMTYSPFINHPTASADQYQQAAEASTRALQETAILVPGLPRLTPKEAGLINALQLRFARPSPDEQIEGYKDYQRALHKLHGDLLPSNTRRGDADVFAYWADAIMVLHSDKDGYHFYQEDRITPLPEIGQALCLLEDCLLEAPHHPLCQHLYIHITEPSLYPERATATAQALANDAQFTQAQHLQHMPSHTFLRTGDYHNAVVSNQRAHASDEAFLAHEYQPYGPAHDTAFLIVAAQTSGEQSVAYSYSDQLRKHYATYPQQPDGPGPALGWHIWRTVRLRFGDWLEVIHDSDALPPGVDWPYAEVLGAHAKGVAILVSTQDLEEGSRILKEDLQTKLPLVEETSPSLFPMAIVANLTLSASVDYWSGKLSQALTKIQKARQEQESWGYAEPPPWYIPTAQCEGQLWLELGQPQQAVAVFREDLQEIPKNRHSWYGLWQALKALPDDSNGSYKEEIEQAKEGYQQASIWADAPEKIPILCPPWGI